MTIRQTQTLPLPFASTMFRLDRNPHPPTPYTAIFLREKWDVAFGFCLQSFCIFLIRCWIIWITLSESGSRDIGRELIKIRNVLLVPSIRAR